MIRRKTVGVLALLVLCVCAAGAVSAQEYPAKPVTIIVGYGPGGTADVTVRIVAQKLGERLGKPFVVENRASAGGIVAAQAVAKAVPDGYTLMLVATGTSAMSPSLFKQLPFDPVKDFDMVSQLATFGYAFVTNAGSKIGTIKELVAEAKANPGKLNIATVAIGSAQFLAAELFKAAAGIEVTIVPYKTSGDVVLALKSNDVQVAVETLAPVVPHLKTNALKAIAYSAGQRFPGLPNVPTVQEGGLPGYDVSAWNGIAAPAKTPRAVVERLNKEMNAVLALPEVQQKFLDLGIVATGGTPGQLTTVLVNDIAKWRDVINKAKIEKQ